MFGTRFELDILFILILKKRLQVFPAAFFQVIIELDEIQGFFQLISNSPIWVISYIFRFFLGKCNSVRFHFF